MKIMHALIYPHQPNIVTERRMLDLADVPAHKRVWWRPVETVGDGVFDSETQKKTGPVTTIEAARVVDTYSITAFTAQELSDRKDQIVNGMDAIQFKLLFNHENRIRALKVPPDPAMTVAQFKAAIKAML